MVSLSKTHNRGLALWVVWLTLICVVNSVCVDCPVGSYSNNNNIECALCNTPGQCSTEADCEPCAPGTFQSSSGQTFCSSCPSGHYQSSSGATSCQPCNPGSYASEQGAATCEPCTSGTYQPASGASECSICSAGTYSNTTATSCTQCDPGSFQPNEGSGWCSMCPKGHYSDVSGSTSCAACPAGEFNDMIGSVSNASCAICPPGTYSSLGSALCTPCGLGYYNPNSGSTSRSDCLQCPAGYYCNHMELAEPFVCQKDYYCPAGSSQEDVCGLFTTSNEQASACEYSITFYVVLAMGAVLCVVALLVAGMFVRKAVIKRRRKARIEKELLKESFSGPSYAGF